MEELVFSATFHKGGLVVIDLKYPHLHFRETYVFKMVANEDDLEEGEEEDLTQDHIQELAMEERNQYEGWWALPLPPLLAPLPDSAYFKLRNVLWPAEFTFDDNSDPASARDWHPRVSETSLTHRT